VNSPHEAGPLLRVCSLLNEAGAKYLVAGAYAMILNRIIRATEGVQVPYLSLQDLIRSKQTYRDQDRADVERLRRLLP
jgi:hypothetical protein